MIQRANANYKEGNDLSTKARASFFNNANPLGDPPVAPKEWDSVTAMAGRARSKLLSLNERVKDAKRLARDKGVSLISVSSEQSLVVKDAYGDKKDDEIMDFLNKY